MKTEIKEAKLAIVNAVLSTAVNVQFAFSATLHWIAKKKDSIIAQIKKAVKPEDNSISTVAPRNNINPKMTLCKMSLKFERRSFRSAFSQLASFYHCTINDKEAAKENERLSFDFERDAN